MRWLFLSLGLFLATHIWLCIRVAKSNRGLAFVTLFVGFPAALFSLFKHRGDAETSITAAFVANAVFTVLFFVSAWQTLVPLLEAQQAALDDALRGGMPVIESAPPAAPAAPVLAMGPASAPSASGSAASAPVDPLVAFSTALQANGVRHSVARIPAAASAPLPAGVTDAALITVMPQAGTAWSATLFLCESAPACRSLAGAQMQQGGLDKRRVLQNGLLLLAMPVTAANDTDLLPAAVASAFRKL